MYITTTHTKATMQPTTMRVMLLGCRPGVAPTCDPAIDLDAPGISQALTRYERERTDTARDAVPLRAGAKPVLFDVRVPLTPAHTRVLMGVDGMQRAHFAVGFAMLSYTDENGLPHAVTDHGGLQPGDLRLACDQWIAHLEDEFGGDALRELAAVVLDRQSAGKRALAPFALPRGLTLAR